MLTWVFSGLVALVYVGLLVVLVVAKDDDRRLRDRLAGVAAVELQPDMLMPVLWLGSCCSSPGRVGALVLAWFTWRRHNWARYLLAASAGVSLLAAAVRVPGLAAAQVACIATIACLFTARSRAWFAHADARLLAASGPTARVRRQVPRRTRPTARRTRHRHLRGPPPGPPPDQQGKPPVW